MPVRKSLNDTAYDLLDLLGDIPSGNYETTASIADRLGCGKPLVYRSVAYLRDLGFPVATAYDGYFIASTERDLAWAYKRRTRVSHTMMQRTITAFIEHYAAERDYEDGLYIKAKANRVVAYLWDFLKNGESARAEDHGLVINEWGEQ
jgi:biotin operon repressor